MGVVVVSNGGEGNCSSFSNSSNIDIADVQIAE